MLMEEKENIQTVSDPPEELATTGGHTADCAEPGTQAGAEGLAQQQEEKELTTAEKVGIQVRRDSKAGKLTSQFSLTKPPLEIPREEIPAMIETLTGEEYGEVIATLKGKKDTYYYNEDLIATNYANMLLLAEDKEIYNTIATMVRFDCKTYPRPCSAKTFTLPPLNLDNDKVLLAVELMAHRSEYADIKSLKVSNGQTYFYSEQHMSQAYARSLAQWIEVDSKDYP